MRRIRRSFAAMRREGRCGLIAYITCGDPSLDASVEIALELENAGADLLELGVPFSDPIADGPVIQAASQRAIERGTTLASVIEVARRIRASSEIPLILFSYLNPILRYGMERFAHDAAAAGIDGVLLTDLPAESADSSRKVLKKAGLATIFLLAPTSTPPRIRMADRASQGFVYYVSTTGVTGARRDLAPDLISRLDEIRRSLRNPIAVGFGISTGDQFATLAPHCDAVVVGSAIVRAIADGPPESAPDRAAAMVREILGGERTQRGIVSRAEGSI
ncbi:MAG TPA: tryptophan synthase subunit alpha [Thermoanaerobaculia bacterium]|nr:tryptophan synthase subunit alpha [Thermoanaerobaculia bacterium]